MMRNDMSKKQQQQRAKSVDKMNKLPPAVTQESRDRAEALKRAYERPKTAHRNARPVSTSYNLPNFTNGRMATSAIAKRIGSTMKRSQSESKNVTKIDYGRSPSREKLDDLRDELFQAKKKMASLETDKKKMQTQLHRVLRDSDKRERYLERLVTSKFQPAELNDTHMARTLTSIQRNEMSREKIIQMQAKELDLLRKNMETSQSKNSAGASNGRRGSDESSVNYESDFTEQSDYPEEPEQVKTNGILKSTPSDLKPALDDKVVKQNEKLAKKKEKESEKMKQKLVIARQYAEQNAKLKERLKELKANYANVQQKTKKKEDDVRQREDQINKQHIESQSDIQGQNVALDELQKERETLLEEKTKNDEKLESLNQELREAYGEIDALKMENEHLHNVIDDLESRVVTMLGLNSGMTKPVSVPRLDMSHINSTESAENNTPVMLVSARSLSNIDNKTLARAMAEIAGAHIERLDMLVRTGYSIDFLDKKIDEEPSNIEKNDEI